MASSGILIRQYVWLIDLIRRNKSLTLSDIKRYWEQDAKFKDFGSDQLSDRTFFRYKKDIFRLFGIEIECNRHDNKYFIKEDDGLLSSSFLQTLLNCLSLEGLIRQNPDVINSIYFEKAPGGMEFLYILVENIIKRHRIEIEYRGYRSSSLNSKNYLFEPYGLKQLRQRWYLIGKNKGWSFSTVLALDRIRSVIPTDETFKKDKQFNLNKYFDEVIGVTVDKDYNYEETVVRFYDKQWEYIESLPLHHSQQLIKETEDYKDYKFKLRAEYEFQREILGMGLSAEILSPDWLRKEFRDIFEEQNNRYKIIPEQEKK